ncbi:MAG: pilus assembly protein PilM [Desulfurivibrio sp.]|nr:pilus assembly protein PilM [Desulfurivibrio sp.]
MSKLIFEIDGFASNPEGVAFSMAIALPRLQLSMPFRRHRRPAGATGVDKRPLALGLDIGSHAVKACELRASVAGYRLAALGSALVPPEAIDDGALVDPAAVSGVIGGLLANLKSKNRRVAISVSGYSVIVKRISLPVMEPAALADYIYEVAEQYLPFDTDEVYLDCHDLQTQGPGEEQTDVMLVAAKKELVDGYLEMLDGLGLTTVVVDVDAFALETPLKPPMRRPRTWPWWISALPR